MVSEDLLGQMKRAGFPEEVIAQYEQVGGTRGWTASTRCSVR